MDRQGAGHDNLWGTAMRIRHHRIKRKGLHNMIRITPTVSMGEMSRLSCLAILFIRACSNGTFDHQIINRWTLSPVSAAQLLSYQQHVIRAEIKAWSSQGIYHWHSLCVCLDVLPGAEG